MLLLSVHPISRRLVKIHWRLFSSSPRPLAPSPPFFSSLVDAVPSGFVLVACPPACPPACCRCCCCTANPLRTTDPTEDDERSRRRRAQPRTTTRIRRSGGRQQLKAVIRGAGLEGPSLGFFFRRQGLLLSSEREPIPFNGLFFVFLRVRCFRY